MPKSILIVDSNDAIRRATRDFIENSTSFVVCGEAADGLDAVDKARKLSPDLIILDISMPRLDGLQAARAIRSLRQTPIILFTLYADAIGSREMRFAGIDAVVSKVADLSLLAAQMSVLLGDAKAARATFAGSIH
jgi:CheY-like chemotaxis protein